MREDQALGRSGYQTRGKRLLDLVVASASVLCLAPLLLAIAVVVRLDSAGPALFRQRRVGRDRRPFECLKFRTMVQGADDAVHREYVQRFVAGEADPRIDRSGTPVLKLTEDDRVTRTGRWLRRWSLDELPQLINVIQGEMSLVGPRPSLPYEVGCYEEWHATRLAVRPGITGLWQVEGRSRVEFDAMVEMDLEYIERSGLWLDLKLLLATPFAVLSGKGAA